MELLHKFKDIDISDRALHIVSLDVFDTVICRKTAEPRAVFEKVADHLRRKAIPLPPSLSQDFPRQRMQAERWVRARSECEDVPLKVIYEQLRRRFGLSFRQSARLKAMEIRQEIETVTGIPQAIELIQYARRARKRIIFASDMYLPRNVIVRMLRRVGAYEEGDGVYISGEVGLTKASGGLFKHILRTERCDPSAIVHIGDHPASDEETPARLGIRCVSFRNAHLSRYERVLVGGGLFRPPPAHVWQQLAGAARQARLSGADGGDGRSATIHQIGANIAGPILLGFALWVLREASARKVKRLYFMARDGQIILEVAKRILPKTDYDLQLHYLHGSRQAWSLPSLFRLSEYEIQWITHVSPILTIRLVARRLDLPPEELVDRLKESGLHIPDLDALLSQREIAELRRLLLRDPAVQQLILDQAARARSILLSYLNQQNLTVGKKVALVDTGWYATSQDKLTKILQSAEYDPEMHGLYFGLRTARPSSVKTSFLFGPTSSPAYQEWGKAFITILEVLCAADHGMTLRYSADGGGVLHPELRERHNSRAMAWGLETLRKGIFDFVDAASTISFHEIDLAEYRSRVLHLIRLLISSPAPQEAEVLGGFEFSSEQTESSLGCIAPPLTFRGMVESLLDKTGIQRKAITFWPEASIIRSNPWVRRLVPLPVVRPFMKLVGKLGGIASS